MLNEKQQHLKSNRLLRVVILTVLGSVTVVHLVTVKRIYFNAVSEMISVVAKVLGCNF